MASSAANNNLPNSTTVQVSYQNLLTQLSSSSELNADSEALTNVTKDNFEDYFSLNGSATYDQTTGIVTITPDENNKVGSFFLKSKIDMNTSFTLTGQVNLGNKTSSQGGADGVGFDFHTGNTTDIGNAGGNLGIGGLQNAIGFKLDTFHNDYGTPWANEDGAQVAPTDPDGYGYDADPDRTKFPQFGAFVKTSQKLVQAQDGHYYSRWWGTTDMSSVQELNSRDLDGQFHDSVVSYDGSNRKLTIKYTETGGDVLTWSTSISDAYKAMAMVVSASTGYYKNLQQFKISSFDFKQAATVNVKYVDQKGNQLAQGTVSYPSGADVNGTYTTGQLEIPNYKFVRMDDGTATGAKSLPATGTLTKAGDNGTVIYVYAPAYTQTSKTISETIKYTDQDGKEVAIGYTADPITFVTVTNPVDNTTTTYYSTKAKTATLDDNGVPTEAGWTKADSTDFAEVVNPEVDGYKVISNDAPNSDLTSVAVQTVYTNSSDLDFTVVYAPAYSTSKVKTVTETVHYIGQDGKPVANDASGIPTSFVTITNPIDGSTATYYSKTESGQPTLNNNGVPVGDWTQGNSTDFAAIINPSVIGQHVVSTTDPGNDLTQTTVKSIDSNSDNLDFTVTYEPNQEAANVTYIDDTTGKTLSAKDLTGDYGSTDPYRTGDTIADYEKQGYQLVSDNYPTNGVVYNQDSTVQSFEVHLTHGTTPVGPNNPQTPGEPINPDNPDGPKWPEGTDKSSVTQTVIRTVNYLDKQTGKVVAKQVTEQVTYNRTAIVDKVTGQIIGYSTTGAGTVDQTDGDKAWTAVDNKSDWDSVTSPDLSSKGYLAPDLATVAQQTVTPGDKDVTVNVYYDHDVVPVNPTNPQTPGEPINPDDPDSPKWPAGTDKNSLTTDVHQTIHYQYGDGSQAAPDKTDSTTFDHQVEIDKVTGEIVKDDGWTAENGKTSFDAKTSPVIAGYTASEASSKTVTGLTEDSPDDVQTIVYAPNAEKANVSYIDDTTGKTLSAKDLTGNYGSTDPYRTSETITGYESQGYQLVSDNYPTNGVVYNQDGTVQSFEVHLTHGTTPVGPNNPQTPGEPINPDNPDGPKWPEGTDKSSVTQTVIRTVNYLDKQTGKVVAKQVTEQVTYNRTAIVDKVTGQIIGYSTTGAGTVDQTDGDKAWTAVDNKSDWDSVTSPDLSSKGYLAPDLATVAQQTVTPGDKDVTVNVYYDHDVVPVNPTNPQTPGEPINPDDPDSPKWPAGTDKNSLTTDVHQTIHYQYGDGSQAAPDKTDSTTFDHQVEIDKVTGEIVKDDGWTAENGKTSFDSKNSPVIPGYTASKPASDSVDGLTQDSKDNVQTIIYTANQEAANVTYIDDTTGKTLSAKDLTGDYGSTDPYRTGDTIADYEKQGYQLVSDNYPTNGVVYNQDSTVQSFEVHLTHGTTQTSESQTVNETIHYVYKNGDKAADDYQATPLNFTRTVTTDKVTGKKTYGSWSSDQSFAAVTSPELKGYTADKAQINKQTVNGDSKDLEFTVTYTKNAPTMTTEKKTVNETVSYVDQNGNELAQPHTASVDFTRQVSTDAVTGEKTYGPWSADQSFAAVTSPELKGYTADKAQINKQTVNGDSKDLEFKVTYTKTPVAGGNVTAKYVDENGNPIADDVIASGNVGDPYSTTQKDVPGYTFKEVQGNPTGSFTDQDQTVTYVYTKNPATDNNGGTGLNQPGNPSQPSNATNNGVINTSTNTGSKVNNGAVNSPELPQTGENNSQSQTMSFIGILLAMFGSLLGFLGIKKRRND
ncbi:MAG: MucBP domain-containing protein [Schleiferilactobacillus harbinensis]|uniref:mucin-binding protein n=1 Tax=Schleiferilactobacillus harbinensis TaxID=304207 RepID=UPI0039E97AA8